MIDKTVQFFLNICILFFGCHKTITRNATAQNVLFYEEFDLFYLRPSLYDLI
jgi:hypothetical protein